MLKPNTASSESGNSRTAVASPSVFVLAVLAPGAQGSASPIRHVAETTGCRSEGDWDFKFKRSYSSNKCSLKIFRERGVL